jgi:hypothetical protein
VTGRRFRINLVGADSALCERLRASLARSPFHLTCSPAPLPPAETDLYVAPARTAAEWLSGAAPAALPPVIAHGPAELLRYAFLAGAADYLREPWLPAELTARPAAGLERAGPRFQTPWGPVSPDGASLETARGTVPFTAHEAAVLRTLLRGRGIPVPREALAQALWGRPARAGSRALDAHVAALRRKICAAAAGAPAADRAADPRRFIVAVRRRGYMVR